MNNTVNNSESAMIKFTLNSELKNYIMEFKNHCPETKITKLPSDIFVWTALGSIVALATLKCLGRKNPILLVGQLAVPILLFGICNRMAKKEDNDLHEITTLWTE